MNTFRHKLLTIQCLFAGYVIVINYDNGQNASCDLYVIGVDRYSQTLLLPALILCLIVPMSSSINYYRSMYVHRVNSEVGILYVETS